ncbi:glycosyltransferase family 2 protein, partial [Bacteroides rodentium]
MDDTGSLPLISIIVPVYNVKEYLEKCLQSVCGQTYRNLEIILIDDGSSDGSGELCDFFAQRDKRIKVIHQTNAGQSAARNRGLAVAQGEYLGFVDSDDWIEPDMYEFLYRLLKENEADISICSHYRDKGKKSVAKYASGEQFVFTRDEGISALAVDKHVRNYMVDKLFKRSLFAGIFFPVNRVFEDLAICYRVFYGAEKIVMQDTPKYHYMIREGSTMQSRYNPQKEYNLFQSVYEQVKFILEKGIWDKAGIYVMRRGISFLDHKMMIKNSNTKYQIILDYIVKMI